MKIRWYNKVNKEVGDTTLSELRIVLQDDPQATELWFQVLEDVGYQKLRRTVFEGVE